MGGGFCTAPEGKRKGHGRFITKLWCGPEVLASIHLPPLWLTHYAKYTHELYVPEDGYYEYGPRWSLSLSLLGLKTTSTRRSRLGGCLYFPIRSQTLLTATEVRPAIMKVKMVVKGMRVLQHHC